MPSSFEDQFKHGKHKNSLGLTNTTPALVSKKFPGTKTDPRAERLRGTRFEWIDTGVNTEMDNNGKVLLERGQVGLTVYTETLWHNDLFWDALYYNLSMMSKQQNLSITGLGVNSNCQLKIGPLVISAAFATMIG